MQSKEKRNLWLHVRVNSDEKIRIDSNAESFGLDTSDYLRKLGMSGKNPGISRRAKTQEPLTGPDSFYLLNDKDRRYLNRRTK